MELVKFLEKFKDFTINTKQLHEQKLKLKKRKIQGSMGKTYFFFGTLSHSPWAIIPMWLHIEAPQKIHEK
jgi:hypothetical protein